MRGYGYVGRNKRSVSGAGHRDCRERPAALSRPTRALGETRILSYTHGHFYARPRTDLVLCAD